MRTKGQIEAEISKAVTNLEKEYTGRGPSDVRCYVLEDMILVRLRGLLLPAEERLITEGDARDGRDAIKHFRGALIEKALTVLEPKIADITGRQLVSMHSDISTKTGERIIVFTLDGVVEFVAQASRR